MNEVFIAEPLNDILKKLDKTELLFIDNIKDKLAISLDVGKPLRYNWLREKKFKDKRLYFIVNTHADKAILVAYGDKKEQQKIIDHVIANKEMYFRIF